MKKILLLILLIPYCLKLYSKGSGNNLMVSAQIYSGSEAVIIGADNYSKYSFGVPIGGVVMAGFKKIQLGLEFSSYASPFEYNYFDQFNGVKRLSQNQRESYFGGLLFLRVSRIMYFKFGVGNSHGKMDIKSISGTAYSSDDLGKTLKYNGGIGFKIPLIHKLFAHDNLSLTIECNYSYHAFPAKYYAVINDNTDDKIGIQSYGLHVGLLYDIFP